MEKVSFTLQIPKPRAKQLAETLANRDGGRMRNPRDYNRSSLKRELQRELNDVKHS